MTMLLMVVNWGDIINRLFFIESKQLLHLLVRLQIFGFDVPVIQYPQLLSIKLLVKLVSLSIYFTIPLNLVMHLLAQAQNCS